MTALQWRMPALTRRRSPDALQETWLVYYGDARVGTISVRSGNPADADQWPRSAASRPEVDAAAPPASSHGPHTQTSCWSVVVRITFYPRKRSSVALFTLD